MEDLVVRFVHLEATPVVSALGYGADPEYQAWESILRFAEDRQMDPWDSTHRFFGFNNPDPDCPGEQYGYEQWMTVPEGTEVDPPLEAKVAQGGLYATLAIHGLDGIGEAWQQLAAWCTENGYEVDQTREVCLEEMLTPIDRPPSDWDMRLYLAVT